MGALLVLAPLCAVVLLNLPLGAWPLRLALGLAGALCAAEGAAALLPAAWWSRPLPFDGLLHAAFPVDDLSRVMFLATSIVGLSAAMVARATLDSAPLRFRFANLMLLAVAGLNGVVLTRDLLGLFVFLEIAAVTSFVLIALEDARAALRAAFKYLVLSAVATAMIVTALALLFMISGSTDFDTVARALRVHRADQLSLAAVALLLGGLSIKAGLVPFHGWLPGAYSTAPPAVSLLLGGIVTKATGIYALIRLVETMLGHEGSVAAILLALGLASIVAGALGALVQSDLKRMLAWSSISQMGYVVLGLGAGGAGVAGAAFHLFNHALFASLLFSNAAAVERQSGTRDMSRLGGIAARMPITGATSVLAMLSAAGLPPLPGFWSKLIIVVAVWNAGHRAGAVVAVAASLLTLAYFLSMQRRVFFGPLAQRCTGLREARGWLLWPAVMLAAIMVAVGLLAPWLFQTFLLPTARLL